MLRHDRDEPLNFHTRPAGGFGSWGAIFHGQGVGVDDKKDDLLRYLRSIDRGLRPLLETEQTPLLLAGVDYLLPIYREASTYPHLLEQVISGNPDRLSNQELHDRAWTLVKPRFTRAQEAAVALYRQLAGTGRTTAELSEVVAACRQGRIDTLFLGAGVDRWGHFNTRTDEVEVHRSMDPGDQELLNLAAGFVLKHGGKVYELDIAQMPADAPVAAILRLPMDRH
jgi:hypothetical protein